MLIPAILAPLLAFLVAGAAIGVSYRIVGRQRPGVVTRGYRYGQLVSGGLLGLGSITQASALKGTGFSPSDRASSQNEALAPEVDTIARLRTFGEKAGLAFQIVDDILDMTQSSEQLGKTAGKDTASDKATWPAVYGIEQSEKDAAQLIADAFAALEPFGEAAAPLKALASYLVERKN